MQRDDLFLLSIEDKSIKPFGGGIRLVTEDFHHQNEDDDVCAHDEDQRKQ